MIRYWLYTFPRFFTRTAATGGDLAEALVRDPERVGQSVVETLLTVVETCRQQKRSAIRFVRDAVERHFRKQPAPSLLAGV
jgi:hypothetical protein